MLTEKFSQLQIDFSELSGDIKPTIHLSKLYTELIRTHLDNPQYLTEVVAMLNQINSEGYIYDVLDINFNGDRNVVYSYITAYDPLMFRTKEYQSQPIYVRKYFNVNVDSIINAKNVVSF